VNGNRSNTNERLLVEYISDMWTPEGTNIVAVKALTGRPQAMISFSIISRTPTPHPCAFDFSNI
jgi:hypothetical protein